MRLIADDLRQANEQASKILGGSEWQKARLGAVESYDTLVNELKKRGVDNPNEYSTLINQKQAIEKSLKSMTSLEQMRGVAGRNDQPLAGATPLKRYGKPEEVAQMMLFLACGDSSFCTGGVYMVDGGVSAGRA